MPEDNKRKWCAIIPSWDPVCYVIACDMLNIKLGKEISNNRKARFTEPTFTALGMNYVTEIG
jgi:hypothetical protein